MKLTGAEIVISCLKEQDVDTVFGYPGGAILNIYDALYKHPEIKHILTAHEEGAAHAADGYARATGKVGVCMATSGPGATNLVTGIATAYMDSIPMIAITANVTKPLLGKDSFQEVDICGITMPITKHGYIVKDVKDLADTIRKAFKIANSDRPGPVLIDITKDATSDTCEYEEKESLSIQHKSKYTDTDIEQAVSLINESKKPFIFVGGGAIAAEASNELHVFAKLIDAPVCDTLMAKGAFDGTDPLYTNMLGMHGTKASNYGINQADLLITLGARFSDRVMGNAKKFAKQAKILHIDIDAAEINKNIKSYSSVVGDLKDVLTSLNAKVKQKTNKEWTGYILGLKEKHPLLYDKTKLTCPYIIEKIDELTPDDTIIVTEVGQHQMWASQFYKYKQPRTFLTSGGLGTMGYGLGASLGAKMGKPDQTVINIAGDGCFRMNLNELATASRHRIPIIEVVINNQVLGMVRQWQDLFYGQRYSHTVFDDGVDFVKVAEALGCLGMRATTMEEFDIAFKKALVADKPVLIDCHIEKDDKVYPMMSPGAALSETFDQSDLKK